MSMTLKDVQAAPRDGYPRPFPNTPENVLEQFSMKGKVVAVTGASDGIGLAVARAMAEAGAHVALVYNTNNAAEKIASELAKQHGITAKAYQLDIQDPHRVEKTVNQIASDFGRLDVFVANSGAAKSKPILEQSLEEYRHLVSVNIDGTFYCAKFAGHVFKAQGFGNLIIVSSISAHIVNVPIDQPVYNATKAAIGHLGKSLAREWREFARVNIVSPGFFDTKLGANPMIRNEAYRMAALGRQGHTKEIKGLFLYLASDASSYQTGSDTIIDGGYTLP